MSTAVDTEIATRLLHHPDRAGIEQRYEAALGAAGETRGERSKAAGYPMPGTPDGNAILREYDTAALAAERDRDAAIGALRQEITERLASERAQQATGRMDDHGRVQTRPGYSGPG